MADGYKGVQSPVTGGSDFNSVAFIAQQVLGRANTSTLVQVKAVTNSGAASPVGFVDVQPLVSQIDGNDNPVPHGVVYNLPYLRMQGGANAVILDPQIGDIGIAIFADRDISAVKAAKKESLPASGRRFSMADGLYLGGVLNGTPTQYVRFSAGGVEIVSPTKVTIAAPDVAIQSITLKHNGVNVGDDHIHGGVSRGSDNTDGPT